MHTHCHQQTDFRYITTSNYGEELEIDTRLTLHQTDNITQPISDPQRFGNLTHMYQLSFVYILHNRIPEGSIRWKSFALHEWQPLILSPECSPPPV